MKEEKAHILVADDEKGICDVLSILLSGEGYRVTCVGDGVSVLEYPEQADLYILDVNMPRMNGFMAGAEIRKRCDAPIIFLTAYSAESDKVMGFSAGADDYIVKPFSNAELLLRVKAVLRRNAPKALRQEENPANRLIFSDSVLDLDRQSVIRGEEDIPLTYTEFKILELLIKNRKRIFSLEHIYQSIWSENAVGDSAIMVHIKNLRKKLGDNSRNPRYIKTAWGKGYYVD
ncbi:MAG: response regulator transcription factor [Ruminococcaceae bacterium]|nr:response regulator transcription factor [Oscillospiraceae bacterium]